MAQYLFLANFQRHLKSRNSNALSFSDFVSDFYSLLFWLTGDFWGSCWDCRGERYCHWWPDCSRWPLSPNRFELQCYNIYLTSFVSEYGVHASLLVRFLWLWNGLLRVGKQSSCQPPVESGLGLALRWKWRPACSTKGPHHKYWSGYVTTLYHFFLNKVDVFPCFNMPLALFIYFDHKESHFSILTLTLFQSQLYIANIILEKSDIYVASYIEILSIFVYDCKCCLARKSRTKIHYYDNMWLLFSKELYIFFPIFRSFCILQTHRVWWRTSCSIGERNNGCSRESLPGGVALRRWMGTWWWVQLPSLALTLRDCKSYLATSK